MLTTYINQDPPFKTVDSTVYVLPAAYQLGNFIMNFNGGYKTFSELTQFDGTANTYQNVAIGVTSFNNFPELVVSKSELINSPVNFSSLYVSDTSTSKYVGFFTFYYDGTGIELRSSTKVL